jgi:aminoglycoside phosphotransferase
MAARGVPPTPVADAGASEPAAPALLGDLLEDAVRDILGPGRVRHVVLAMSRDENPKVTVLAFPDHATAPALVVKIATTPGATAAVLAEAAALRRLQHADPTRVGGTVPACLDVRVVAGLGVLTTSACPGVPLSTLYHQWRHTASPARVCADFAAAGSWLGELARVTEDGLSEPQDLPTRIRTRWPDDLVASRVAAGVAEDLARLGPAHTGASAGIVHGDFWPGNILCRTGTVTGVVDWEHAAHGSDPLRDRTRFVLGYTLYLDRHTVPGRVVAGHAGLVAGAWGEPVRYLLRGSSWYTETVVGFVDEGLVATGRPTGLWREALLVGLGEIAALSDHAGFARQHLELASEILSWPR